MRIKIKEEEGTRDYSHKGASLNALFSTSGILPRKKRPKNDCFVFVLFVERGCWCEGVLLSGSRKSFGTSVLRAFFVSTACFTCDEHSCKWVGGVDLSLKAPDLGSWGCTRQRYTRRGRCRQIDIDIAHCCRRAELGVRHADLRREAAPVIAETASVLSCDTNRGFGKVEGSRKYI